LLQQTVFQKQCEGVAQVEYIYMSCCEEKAARFLPRTCGAVPFGPSSESGSGEGTLCALMQRASDEREKLIVVRF
jgi:hypothetical protein